MLSPRNLAYVCDDRCFSKSEYIFTLLRSPSDHLGKNTSVDLGDFGWLDVQEDLSHASR